jgi:glycosyltransferase involved in cell wall biosynthesis
VLRLTGRLLRRPDIVTAVSDHLAARVQAFRRGPVIVVPPAVAPVTLVAPPGDSATIRLVSVGGLVPGKDPFLALDIVRELHRREVGAELTWVGDGPLRAALESAAGPGDRLTLLGAQDDAGVARSLDSADVFLLPTRGETLCLSAVEAITHGRPVVIGSNGGQREFVSAANGRLVRPRTPASYADAILDVWALRSTRDPAAIAASIGDRFQPEVVRAAYNEAYERAAAVYR